ncbi:uncharacterized protein LOC125044169 [Penaeus chinensis]|uniref:uncharacterized protein LOC125044169 n=1 Tax=Penaeus chinensis TaxID=139456 RepID=UPI001FB64960|nr:uncharacterized protein LOC125044169 [Penaeus chinensis]
MWSRDEVGATLRAAYRVLHRLLALSLASLVLQPPRHDEVFDADDNAGDGFVWSLQPLPPAKPRTRVVSARLLHHRRHLPGRPGAQHVPEERRLPARDHLLPGC